MAGYINSDAVWNRLKFSHLCPHGFRCVPEIMTLAYICASLPIGPFLRTADRDQSLCPGAATTSGDSPNRTHT
jgi:hypothetical protein